MRKANFLPQGLRIVEQHEVRAAARGVGEILRHQLAGKIDGRWMLFPQGEQLFARERCAAAGGTGEGKVHHYAFQVERQTLRAIAAGGFLQQRAQRPARKARADEERCALGREREGTVERHPLRTQAGGEAREKRNPVRIRIGLKVRQHALKAALDAFRDDGAAEHVDAWDRPGAAVGKAHEPAARESGRVAARQAPAQTDGIGYVDERQCGP